MIIWTRADEPDQSSPEATLAGFQRALLGAQWQLALQHMTLEAQQNMVGVVFMAAGYATDGDAVASAALAKIMRRYGLRKQERVQTAELDLARIIGELVRWSKRYLPHKRQLDLAGNVAQATYSEQRVSEDRAYVIATCDGRRSEVRLKRLDGRWYLL